MMSPAENTKSHGLFYGIKRLFEGNLEKMCIAGNHWLRKAGKEMLIL